MLQFFVTLQALIADRVERDDKGATMIEYGMICGLIVGVVFVAMGLLGTSIAELFRLVGVEIAGAF